MSSDAAKGALRMMPYGFYSITSRDGEEVNAMVANWVTQASFEPRMMAVGLQKSAYSHKLIEQGGVFAINIFKTEDQEAIMPFTKGRAKKPDKMVEAKYTEGAETGCPILEGAAAYIECRVVNLVDIGGDHDLLVGEVVGGGVNKEAEAAEVLSLVALGWSYAG